MSTLKGNIVVGNYAATLGGNAIGMVERAQEMNMRVLSEEVRADQYGETVIDEVYLGMAVFWALTFKEWTATNRDLIVPWGTAGDWGDLGTPGKFMGDHAAQLVLTAQSGTSAAAADGPATLTAPNVVIAPENDMRILLGNTQRDVTVICRVYPYDAGSGVIKYFTTT